MEQILHQLIDGKHHIILKAFNHPFGDAGFLPSSVCFILCNFLRMIHGKVRDPGMRANFIMTSLFD